MVSVKPILDKRYIKSDGTYPIVFRLTYKGVMRNIQTGISCKINQWNGKQLLINSNVTGSESLNESIKLQQQEILKRLLEYQRRNSSINLQELKDFISDKQTASNTVGDFWRKEIENLMSSSKYGNSAIYQECLRAFEKVVSLDCTFKHINYSWLRKAEILFQKKGCKPNTISIYFRTLRAIFNKAVKLKVVDFADYPFREFHIQKESTVPRTLTLEEMKAYFNLSISPTSPQYKSWLIGKMIFMLRGINLKDLCLLTIDNIKSDRIIFRRAKTGKVYSIQMLPELEILIAELEGGKTLLNVLSIEDLKDTERSTRIMRQKTKIVNKHLGKLSKLIASEEPITTYVFRYTWANIAKQLGYSKDMIAEGLGHEYGNPVTGIYLEQYDLKLIDEMNTAIIKAVAQ